MSCAACSSYTGCAKHGKYRCVGCKRIRPFSDGCDDDMPGHCDDCWAKAHAGDIPAGTATPGTHSSSGVVMSAPRVRELRVTDIRCSLCDAAPGMPCTTMKRIVPVHLAREQEHEELVAAGWEWQEVDPRDDGAAGGRKP